MAVISVKRHSFLSRFKRLIPLQNLYHKCVEVGNKPQSRSDKDSIFEPGEINVTKWKKMDSRSLGINRTMIPSSPYVLLKTLRDRGFEAYLVGGCVRDLLLNRTPKDFDVITTADLHQVRKQFHRCQIIGRKFPICVVHIKGSVIEVSSFKTLAKHAENKEKFLVSQMPRGCNKSDLDLWKNSMHRDFTINSLFFDPLSHKIYDYTNGMKDLLELKLRTLVPARLSFTEDCARILRGLRIAARLGLSFSKDTEAAIHEHALSILDLSESRIMMEINYMLSFGAAESSLHLLQRFHILQILLPFQVLEREGNEIIILDYECDKQAAYISQQTAISGQCTMMLMKLFSNLDKLVTCDHPSACRLWIGLLAFHQALVTKPQDPFVILTFASVLYHQKWEDGLQFARKCGQPPVNFEPEVSEPRDFISDNKLSKKVRELALLVLDSIDALVQRDSLRKMMSKFPCFPCSSLVFIPKNSGQGAAQIFHVLTHKLETYNKGRTSFKLDYNLLGKGDASETRLALGKIILNTMGCGVDQDGDSENKNVVNKKIHKKHILSPTDPSLRQENGHKSKKQKPVAKLSNGKNQNAVTEKKIEDIVDGYVLKQEERKEVVLKQTSSDPKIKDCAKDKPVKTGASQSSMPKLICTVESITENENFPLLETQKPKEILNLDAESQADKLITDGQRVNRKQKRKHTSPLSALFK